MTVTLAGGPALQSTLTTGYLLKGSETARSGAWPSRGKVKGLVGDPKAI